jgi:DNA polymerase III epsilon subunit-like protein
MRFDYHLENIHNRLQLLLMVLQYDTEVTQDFTVWERMLINQERAAMFDFKNYLFKELEFDKVRMFLVPDPLEEKIQSIARTIESKSWQPKPQEY